MYLVVFVNPSEAWAIFISEVVYFDSYIARFFRNFIYGKISSTYLKKCEKTKIKINSVKQSEFMQYVQPVRLKSIQCIKISNSLYIIKWSAVDTFLAHGLYWRFIKMYGFPCFSYGINIHFFIKRRYNFNTVVSL
jgi:hypothetical protein